MFSCKHLSPCALKWSVLFNVSANSQCGSICKMDTQCRIRGKMEPTSCPSKSGLGSTNTSTVLWIITKHTTSGKLVRLRKYSAYYDTLHVIILSTLNVSRLTRNWSKSLLNANNFQEMVKLMTTPGSS